MLRRAEGAVWTLRLKREREFLPELFSSGIGEIDEAYGRDAGGVCGFLKVCGVAQARIPSVRFRSTEKSRRSSVASIGTNIRDEDSRGKEIRCGEDARYFGRALRETGEITSSMLARCGPASTWR